VQLAAAKRQILLVELGDDAEVRAMHERAIGSARCRARPSSRSTVGKNPEHGGNLARARCFLTKGDRRSTLVASSCDPVISREVIGWRADRLLF
jgi:hypothetical protein